MFVDGSIDVNPRAFNFDVSFVRSPRTITWRVSTTRRFGDRAGISCNPTVLRSVINRNASLVHDIFQIPIGDTVSNIEKLRTGSRPSDTAHV